MSRVVVRHRLKPWSAAGTPVSTLSFIPWVEAFTKFVSDLDAATQAKQSVDVVIVEVLKQPVHKPLPVEKQVTILYALTHGFLDTIPPVDDIVRFEEEFHTFFWCSLSRDFGNHSWNKKTSRSSLDAAITELQSIHPQEWGVNGQYL